MPVIPDTTLLDILTPAQAEVLKALVAGATVTAAAEKAGIHRSTVHVWARNHPAFARTLLAARQDRAETLVDELAALSVLARDTFRQLLSDPATPAATRLKAAMEIVKLVQSQRPTEQAKLKHDLYFDRLFEDLHLAKVANAEPANSESPHTERPAEVEPPVLVQKPPLRNAPCPAAAASSTNVAAET